MRQWKRNVALEGDLHAQDNTLSCRSAFRPIEKILIDLMQDLRDRDAIMRFINAAVPEISVEYIAAILNCLIFIDLSRTRRDVNQFIMYAHHSIYGELKLRYVKNCYKNNPNLLFLITGRYSNLIDVFLAKINAKAKLVTWTIRFRLCVVTKDNSDKHIQS